MPGGNVTAKIEKATLYRCIDPFKPSRSNVASSNVLSEGENADSITQVLHDFSNSEARCNLALVLSNGIEINIVRSLKADVPALGDDNYDDYWGKPEDEREPKDPYDLCLSMWPVQEPDFGLPPGEIDA